ncbi:dihydroxyacetone kinase subunit L [Nocardioides dongxiaopingii]|uniref:dihydroxyacetone kinase subunit DhaL n=1 Tax=Nocardioides sp. S-1144 TaxID=2582905 RepID=UPI0011652FE1|nr:dihydroxyacetone kinase subunit DhaL [Nocardioides sp. S-1144]QDH11020.1 dihydroxyacetone kinase subunit L [Nocardioides sp. S-1144]
MAGTVTQDQLVGWLAAFRDAVHEHGAHLTELDSAIGDADHGSNLVRGMDAVMAAVQPPPDSVGALLKKVGMTLVTSVGGASGPLYGTFFLRAGAAADNATEFDVAGLAAVLRAGVEGVVARGKADLGDKTMYDALGPALEALDAALADGADAAGAVRAAADAAARGRDATEPMQALKGRASYLGERSIGHVDPGSASATLLVEALARALADPPADPPADP